MSIGPGHGNWKNLKDKYATQFKEAKVTFNAGYGPSLDTVEGCLNQLVKQLKVTRDACSSTITRAEKTKVEINLNKSLSPAIKHEACEVIDGDANDWRLILKRLDAMCNESGWK
jgi:hypothetical protein